MTKAELKLAAYLLEQASEEFSRHGCNDLWLVKDVGLSEQEAREVHESIEALLSPDDRREYNECSYDWAAMCAMAAKLLAEAER